MKIISYSDANETHYHKKGFALSFVLRVFGTWKSKPLFQREDNCKLSRMKIILYSDANEAHYHKKGFALSLVLEVRVFGTWKSETIEQ